MDGAQEFSNAKLIRGNVGKILFNMTIPMMFGMFAMVAFNLIDTFFVGKLGVNELAAISFTFPVIMVITSLALGIGIGTSALVSKAIGRGHDYKVKRLTTTSLLLVIIIVLLFAVIGILTIDPLFKLLGASAEIIDLIRQYMVIWYLGIVFVMVPMVGNNAIRATGDTKTPGMIMVFAMIVNMVLDPILIFGWGPIPRMELQGAAIATLIARASTLIFAIWILYFREKMITFELKSSKEIFGCWKEILHIGIPASAARIIVPIAIGIITALLARYGTEAVAAFGVGVKIEFFAMAVIMALSSVLGPFVGQNWGARKKDRVRLGLKISNRFSMLFGLGTFLLFVLLAKPMAGLFSDSQAVISGVTLYLWIVPVSYGLQGIFMISNNVLNVLNRPIQAALLVLLQMFVFFVPFSFLGSYLFGLVGVFGGISLSFILSGSISYIVLRRRLS